MANQAPKTQQEVKAFARYIHMSPQKLRLVADLVRKTRVEDALEQLRFSSKNAALPIAKVINSAMANAIHNYNLKKEDLFVKAITIDGGPVYKRMEPRAQGRGFVVRKRTSHINVILEARQQARSKRKRSIFSLRSRTEVVETADKPAAEVEEGKVAKDSVKHKGAPKSDEKMKQQKVSLKRRLFNRKSGE
jgi:large subunit ribosomal protein L22